MSAALTLAAPAKVNLALWVGPSRPDGYHEVRTVLQTVDLCDRVTVARSEALTVRTEPSLGIDQRDDLAYRAAVALGEATGRAPGVAISVEKRIPHGAGLGGGSSDAAAVLVALCRLWGLDPGSEEVRSVASALGADVPFFLEGGAALMAGRGDVLVRRLPPLDAGVVLLKPPGVVRTADAYREFDRLAPAATRGPRDGVRTGVGAVVESVEAGSVEDVAAAMSDSLEGAAVSSCGDVATALEVLRGAPGVSGAMVSGSGSTVFGLCADGPAAEEAARHAAAVTGWWAHGTSMRSGGVG